MIEVSLFAEDFGHEAFLTALVRRIAKELGLEVTIRLRSVRGGRGKALSELEQYLADLERGRDRHPDLLLVATDANCEGYSKRRRDIERKAARFEQAHPGTLVVAIPDPHVERWMLVDSRAFKAVLGHGCDAPDSKCERQRYKQVLLQAMQTAGIVPPLGGMEYAGDIVEHLDLDRAGSLDDSLGQTVAAIRNRLKNLS
jgi:hypothetical protein